MLPSRSVEFLILINLDYRGELWTWYRTDEVHVIRKLILFKKVENLLPSTVEISHLALEHHMVKAKAGITTVNLR